MYAYLVLSCSDRPIPAIVNWHITLESNLFLQKCAAKPSADEFIEQTQLPLADNCLAKFYIRSRITHEYIYIYTSYRTIECLLFAPL